MERKLQRLPIGIQSFKKLRDYGFLYVDKTALVYDLTRQEGHYFLSRPRRFGKSLLLSTIEAYFKGQRECFEGLAIEELEKDWVARPVFRIDMLGGDYKCADDVNLHLSEKLLQFEKEYGTDGGVTPSGRFANLIRRAHEQSGHRVVVLVDEYDKPLLGFFGKPAETDPERKRRRDEARDGIRDAMKAFFGVLKSEDEHIKFAFITGVSKFSKVSIFSDLNNITDISLDSRYEDICGITDGEIDRLFKPFIEELALKQRRETTLADMRGRLKKMYDGYHFNEDQDHGAYNPFSLLSAFQSKKIRNYWFSTGTPTFLVEMMRDQCHDLSRLSAGRVPCDNLDAKDVVFSDPVPVLYQTGYLTIKGYEEGSGTYLLGFPNDEVEESFLKFLLPFYTAAHANPQGFLLGDFVGDVQAGDTDAFMTRLKALLDDTPYEVLQKNKEAHYQNVLFTVFRLMGFYTSVEYHLSSGSADMVVRTPKYVYVFEFKYRGTTAEALRQIEERGYARPFAADKRRLAKVGVSFLAEGLGIDRWEEGSEKKLFSYAPLI